MPEVKTPHVARPARGLNPDYARNIAVRAVGFLANDLARLDRFLARVGAPQVEFWRRPDAANQLASVLDFLIADESALLDFSRAADITVETVYEARRVLAMSSRSGYTIPRKQNLDYPGGNVFSGQ